MTGNLRGPLAAALFLFSRALLAADPVPEAARACEACHGPGGNATLAGIPSIAAQPRTFIENQLVYFREALRNAPVMQQVAKGMKDEDITALAKYFSSQPARVVETSPVQAPLVERAQALSRERHCGQCHLPQYQGREQMARLAGQREDYLYAAMVGYRDGTRSAADTTMTEVLYGLPDADLKALAHYLARHE